MKKKELTKIKMYERINLLMMLNLWFSKLYSSTVLFVQSLSYTFGIVINCFIQYGCIKLIKCYSKDIIMLQNISIPYNIYIYIYAVLSLSVSFDWCSGNQPFQDRKYSWPCVSPQTNSLGSHGFTSSTLTGPPHTNMPTCEIQKMSKKQKAGEINTGIHTVHKSKNKNTCFLVSLSHSLTVLSWDAEMMRLSVSRSTLTLSVCAYRPVTQTIHQKHMTEWMKYDQVYERI